MSERTTVSSPPAAHAARPQVGRPGPCEGDCGSFDVPVSAAALRDGLGALARALRGGRRSGRPGGRR